MDVKIMGVVLTVLSMASLYNGRLIDFDNDDCAACKFATGDWLQLYGYPTKNYTVATHDGYLLQLFRIIHGKGNHTDDSMKKIPVLMQHGCGGSSDVYVITIDNINDSYATRLADAGYDVWMTNFRGSKYVHHEKYTRQQFQYWNGTLDDWALTDLKTNIDFVLNATGFSSLVYVGHSVGGLVISMLVAENPEYNEKIHYAQLLSPVLYLTKNPMFSPNPKYGILRSGPSLLRASEFLVKHGMVKASGGGSASQIKLLSKLCTFHDMAYFVCMHTLGVTLGYDPSTFDGDVSSQALELYLDEVSQSVSAKVQTHFMQIALAGYVQKYDYKEKNEQLYGQKTPPWYKLSTIKLNIRVYYPKNDVFIDKEDNERFFSKMKNSNLSVHEMSYHRFNHLDYFFGQSRFRFLDLATRDMNEFHSKGKEN